MVKVKSHSGCQLIEMADELADIGCASEDEPICPGPQIYGSLRLRIQPSVREQIDCDKKEHPLPRDGAPNKALLKGVVAVNTQRNFATLSSLGRHCIVQTPDSNAVRTCIAKCDDPTVRC